MDKPEGITSYDVVRIMKRYVKPAKVGHSGTLDAAASGLMVLLIGAGTRALDYLDENPKKYAMGVLLGEETDTGDREGTLIRSADATQITVPQIKEALQKHLGVQDQIPPHFSAIKQGGVPLYKLARKGVFPEVTARKIEVFSLEMISWDPPNLDLELVCTKGTYARALARDIGNDLAVGGRLERLRRLWSGRFRIEDAMTASQIEEGGTHAIAERLIPLDAALAHIPELKVLPMEAKRLMRGNQINVTRSRLLLMGPPEDSPSRLLRIVVGDGDLIILVRPEPGRGDIALQPVKLFNTREG